MGQWVPINESESPGEKRVFAYLKEHLPAGYTFFTNFNISEKGGREYEFDCVVLAPHAIYVLEIKDIQGRIVVDQDTNSWVVSNGKKFLNPLDQAEKCAKVLKSKLKDYYEQFSTIPVQSCVCIAGEKNFHLDFKLDNVRSRRIQWYQGVEKYIMGQVTIDRSFSKMDITTLNDIFQKGIRDNFSLPWIGKGYYVHKGLWFTRRYSAYYAVSDQFPYEYLIKIYALSEKVLDDEAKKFAKDLNRDLSALRKIEAKGDKTFGGQENVAAGINAIYDAPKDRPAQRRYIVVMEFVKGVILESILHRDLLSIDEKCHIGGQLCRGLAFSHSAQVIHRNLHPENILKTRMASLKLSILILQNLLMAIYTKTPLI